MKVYRARASFAAPDHRFIHEGDVVGDDDPILEGREDLFELVGARRGPLQRDDAPRTFGPEDFVHPTTADLAEAFAALYQATGPASADAPES